MIVRAAIKRDGMVYVGAERERHHHVIKQMIEVHGLKPPAGGTQGFVDHNGNFLDRYEAVQHAWECGQLSSKRECPKRLYSEDLW